MQGAMVLGHALEAAAIGLELLELIARRVVAIGAATHVQLAVLALERDLFLVTGPPAPGDCRMPLHPFLRGRRWREAPIQIALFRGELAQRSYGNGVGHEAAARQLTLQTQTGISRATQKLSQRIWLSCSRSPGPLTSISR